MHSVCTRNSVRTGSSPRGRGTLSHGLHDIGGNRFIPARAGNTHLPKGPGFPGPVHPRAGGEHMRRHTNCRRGHGSSPRGRGTRQGASYRCLWRWFIPARAGNTDPAPRGGPPASVHPRAGGEHAADDVVWDGADGSSPRGRGTREEDGRRVRLHRFIPARAGNTEDRDRGAGRNPVHPRAGGEHCLSVPSPHCAAGSSPRGRGTPPHDAAGGYGPRFIPARAGNTLDHRGRRDGWTVHPRAGGEHPVIPPLQGQEGGSSPRGRGTQGEPEGLIHLRRFIPARAGNTSMRRSTSG